MGTKQVRLDEDVYAKIAEKKRSDETFSDAIDRMVDDWSLVEFDMELSEAEHAEFRNAIEAVEAKTSENVDETLEALNADDE
jgi:predicted CopG family antitoxin